jgi:hypothetical protein
MALLLALVVGLLAQPRTVLAQVFESVGSRALGMGGAFVAVADDGSAAFWNPAGVALAPKGHLTVEWVRFQTGDQNLPPLPGPTKRTSSFASFGTSNYGFAFGSFQRAELVSTNLGLAAENLKVTQYSVTVLQGLSKQIIVGSTLKFLRGYSALGPVIGSTGGTALSNAYDYNSGSVDRFDFDIGVLVNLKKVRLGLSTKNLQEPSFPSSAGTAITLKREVRSGISVLPTGGLTLAMDVDLDTVDLRGGLRRMIALGGEQRIGSRLALRGGVRWSVTGNRQLVGTAGGSVALRAGAWLDLHYTQGDLDGDRGFGIAFRAGS